MWQMMEVKVERISIIIALFNKIKKIKNYNKKLTIKVYSSNEKFKLLNF